jgi:monoamine oxidase
LTRRSHRVIVVGAGFTGLAAATELAAMGVDILVLEARDRVGGRVETMLNELGEPVDTGGQFFCEDMPEVTALARRLGKSFVPTPVEGAFTVQPEMSEEDAEQAYAGAAAIRERMNGLEPRDPAIAGLTVAAWLERQNDPAWAKAGFHSMVEGLWCRSIDEIPLWYLIDYDRRVTNEIPELQYFLKDTMQSVADDMAAGLGGRVVLNAAVSRIGYGAAGVAVVSSAGRYEAERVIVAVPPVMAAKVAFEPALPERLKAALSVWKSGMVIKIHLRYREAFWRDRGLSGMVAWRDVHGLFCCDTSRDEDHPALVVFIGGPLALEWRSLDNRAFGARLRTKIMAALGPEAADFISIEIRDWTDDAWSGGAYSDLIMDMSAYDTEAILREGAGAIQFASSELSPSFPGYVEGAIVAGRIVAKKVASGVDLK